MHSITVATLLASALAAPIDIKRIDIHVDGKRPIAGERSRFAVSPEGGIAFTYTLVAGKPTYLPVGVIGRDGQIRLGAIESETTWNVEGWGLHGWPFDLAFAGPGDLRYAVRFHGKPYGVDYWHKVDGVWRLETFGQNVTYGGNNVALGILPDKRPVVLSVAANRSRLCVWERSSQGRWTRNEPAELSGVAGGDFDLGVRRDGSLLVVFCPSKGGPVYATRSREGVWQRGTIDDAKTSLMLALAMDRQGQAYVAYGVGPSKNGLRQLRYAVLRNAEWRSRTVAEAPEGRHVGRTDIAVAAGRAAIAWEMGAGSRFAPKDYGGRVGGVMLTLVGPDGQARTHELVKENAGRPSLALAPDGKAAYVGVYTGNGHGDDFYLLACGLDGSPAPDLRPPREKPEDLLVKGCLNEIHSGNAHAEKRGMSRIDMSRLDAEQRLALIERFLSSDDFVLRANAARELARSPRELASRLSQVLSDPSRLVRQQFLAQLDLSGDSISTVVPHLLDCLKSTDATSRLGAVEAIMKCRDHPDEAKLVEAIAALTDDLGSRDRTRSGSAGMALEYLADLPHVEGIVRQRLESGDALTKAHAALTLSRMKKAFDVALLADVAKGDDEAAGLTLCGLLAQIRSRDCVPLLVAALSSPSPAVRASAAAALRSIALVAELKPVAKHPKGMDLLALRVTGKGKPDELAARTDAIAALVAALGHEDANVREKACDALGRVEAKASIADIEKLLTDSDAGVRLAAKTAIGVLRGSQPGEFLTDLGVWRQQIENRRAFRVRNTIREPTQIRDGVVLAGSDKQLLTDDFVIEEMHGLQRKLHTFKKHPRNPVFQSQVPWEEGWVDCFMSTVLYDEKERAFKLWYRCGPRHSLTGYAVSEDGIHWARPNIAASPWQELEQHNLVGFEGKVGIWKCPGRNVIRRPDVDAAKRYSSFFFRHDKNYVVSYSADGITWTQPQAARRAFGDVVSIVWDGARERYLLFPKYMTRKDGFTRRSFAAFQIRNPQEPGSRVLPFLASHREDAHVAAGASRAFGSLLPNVLRVSQFHSQIYSVTPISYEGVVVALYDFWTLIGSNEGPLDMLMKVSRDMKTWDDVDFPHRALEIGRFGEWDSGMVYGANTMLVVDDEIRLYYLGANMGHCTRVLPMTRPYHRIGMGLATLRLDGFASLHAGETEGELTTKPLTFEGRRLVVNADCPDGSLRVELLDKNGKMISGFGRDDAEPFAGDGLRHAVTWRGTTDVSRLAGEPVRIRFLLKHGDLYAFHFGQ